jgi:FtsP/CotA-like multicopper oxidase with cupredoxin domain
MWMSQITENPAIGATEVWEIYNHTVDAHPIHIHLVQFKVRDRQNLLLDEEEEVIQPLQLDGGPILPDPREDGFKDTVIALPGQVTRVDAHFDREGLYAWHCHIVEHEDNEMMRPYHVGPIPSDLPLDS